MDKIKVAVLNPTAISEAEKMMVCAARLTQRGHTVKDLSDFLALYDKGYTEKTAKVMTQLPHPTIQKFAVINAVKQIKAFVPEGQLLRVSVAVEVVEPEPSATEPAIEESP